MNENKLKFKYCQRWWKQLMNQAQLKKVKHRFLLRLSFTLKDGKVSHPQTSYSIVDFLAFQMLALR